MRIDVLRTAVVLALAASSATRASAQPLGSFRWQLQPYCNVVTLNVTRNGTVYTLDGYDDLCGAAARASAAGIAFPNPDGTVGFGLTLVVTPGAAALHIDATISLATFNGTWRDSAGNTGPLLFNPTNAGSPPRPPPVTQFASGLSAGNAAITNVGPPTSVSDAATKGYVDAADAATLGAAAALVAGTSLPPAGPFTFQADGGFVARGASGVGTIPASGFGTRLMWHPAKGAFRAGLAGGSHWDDNLVGIRSVAFGSNTIANGGASTALGNGTVASGLNSLAGGTGSTASGFASVAIGDSVVASASSSVALGEETTASGVRSIALGVNASTNGWFGTFVFGDASTVGSGADVTATTNNQFTVRAAGGTRFFSTSDTTEPAPGVQLPAGGSGWTTLSDVGSKTNFRDVDGEAVLGKLARMPIREWNYRSQDRAVRHVGPTAQEFHAAFGLGEDPLGINSVDADGIALRAIQALEARTRQENDALTLELATLRRQLDDVRNALASAAARR